MGFFSDGRKQTVDSFDIPFERDGLVHIMVMNVFGSTTEMVNAMVNRLMSHGFTIIDVDVYPDPSVKGATGAPCYKAIFNVK